MLKKCLKISGLFSLLSFGLFWLYDGTELADTFGIILIVSVCLFIISALILYGKKREAEREQEDIEILNRAREEGIAQARAEAAKRRNITHAPIVGSALICPVCMGSGKNAGGYICPRCNVTGHA